MRSFTSKTEIFTRIVIFEVLSTVLVLLYCLQFTFHCFRQTCSFHHQVVHQPWCWRQQFSMCSRLPSIESQKALFSKVLLLLCVHFLSEGCLFLTLPNIKNFFVPQPFIQIITENA